MKLTDADLHYLEALGRNGHSILTADTWEEAGTRLRDILRTSAKGKILLWENAEDVVRAAWMKSARLSDCANGGRKNYAQKRMVAAKFKGE